MIEKVLIKDLIGKQGIQLKKKVTVLLTTIMLGIGSVSAIPNVKADTQLLTSTQELNRFKPNLLI